MKLHHNIKFDPIRDIIFDGGSFFKQMKAMGINRLFYVGGALNLCVLHSRKFSAVPAVRSGQFREVGIIQDLTVSSIRRNPPRLLSDQEIIQQFVLWIRRALPSLDIQVWDST
jgi:hypothetical protein